MMLCAFYDKFLCPEDMILSMSVVLTVLLSWKKAMTKLKGKSKHMPTCECQTFEDTIIVVEGLILNILIVAADNPDEHIMPWLFTSDACEQLHAFLLIGIHAGMKTKLCCKDVLYGRVKLVPRCTWQLFDS